jgi:hypothetical protein
MQELVKLLYVQEDNRELISSSGAGLRRKT